MSDEHDTCPPLPEGAPPWAATLYDMLLMVIASNHKLRRQSDARFLKLEAEVFGVPTPTSGFAEEDTDPGPRN